MSADPRLRTSWILGAALVAFLACGVGHYLAVSRQQARLAASRHELDRLRAEVAPASAVSDDLPRLREQARALAERVPRNTDLSLMLESLGADLDHADVQDREISTRPTTPAAPGLSRIGVTVRFRGPYERAMAVLGHVERAPRLARVDKLTLERPATPSSSLPSRRSPGSAGGDGAMLRVELEFSTFARTGEEQGPWAQLD